MRVLLCLLVLLGTASVARAQDGGSRPFGFGLMLGAPTGLTAKWYLGKPFALQFGFGVDPAWRDEDGLHIAVDAIWHPAILARDRAFTLPFYFGVGGRLLFADHHHGEHDHDDTHLGVRVPFGLLMDFNKVPIDIFFELAVVVDFLRIEDYEEEYDHDIIDLNAVVGIRYYF